MRPNVKIFYLMTLDPVHIGTGGYRLGRVDNTIVREPGTKVPKIPGTAIHGAVRHYAAQRLGKPQCAGQKGHCGQPTCPICYTFGAIKDNSARSGVVSISDARIVLFPVYSMFGPVWIATPERLRDSDLMSTLPEPEGDKAIWNNALTSENRINLGWLMVEREARKSFDPKTIKDGAYLSNQIKERMVVVSERLFTHIVNSNLEVRTSVSIDPETGAADEGALFTYEAIPRATILWMDVVEEDFKGEFPSKVEWEEIIRENNLPDNPDEWEDLPADMPEREHPVERVLRKLGYIGKRPEGNGEQRQKYWDILKSRYEGFRDTYHRYVQFELNWDSSQDVITAGLQWAEHLGIGGMGTRGFGRVRCLHHRSKRTSTPQPLFQKNSTETAQERQDAPAQAIPDNQNEGDEG